MLASVAPWFIGSGYSSSEHVRCLSSPELGSWWILCQPLSLRWLQPLLFYPKWFMAGLDFIFLERFPVHPMQEDMSAHYPQLLLSHREHFFSLLLSSFCNIPGCLVFCRLSSMGCASNSAVFSLFFMINPKPKVSSWCIVSTLWLLTHWGYPMNSEVSEYFCKVAS